MTQPAERLLADPSLTSAARAWLTRFFAWGARPTVEAYCDLFASDGTLLDAGMDRPIAGPEIREAITRILSFVPDFLFSPVQVVHEGAHVFVVAQNRATAMGRALAWDAVYAITLDGDRVARGRRYYDQAAILGGESLLAPPSPVAPGESVDGEATGSHVASDDQASSLWSAEAGVDLAARETAWNRLDVPALLAAVGGATLCAPGVPRPIADPAEQGAVLERFGRVTAERTLTVGASAVMSAATAIEWVGTIGGAPAPRRFAMVEIIDAAGAAPRRWRLAFDTMGLRSADAETQRLRAHVQMTGKAD